MRVSVRLHLWPTLAMPALRPKAQCPVSAVVVVTEIDPLRTSISPAIVGLMLARDDNEHPIPEELRPRFRELVAAFVVGDYHLSTHRPDGVAPVDARLADFIAEQINSYGAKLAPLNDEVWQRSIYAWDGRHWQFLIDLTITGEPVSDLVLHARLPDYEEAQIEVWSVHVP
ncbi:DUF7668 domain-containing protein [Brevundimonas sp. VNH65]|uniref:DUF7668 domain-containing protein n=1 Tax=Brevundimonas sp. VNH65 TaxID=3400917 RepID=UPI003BFFA0E0